MVPVSLIRRVQRALSRLGPHRQIACVGVATGSVALILVGWLAVERGEESHAGNRPSLMELLDQVGSERGKQDGASSGIKAPQPPRASSWTSPLARQCSGVDPTVQKRLKQLGSKQETWRDFVAIHPTNFGERFKNDAFGQALDASPRLVVLHETVYSLTSAVNTFQTPHPRDEDQVSYHTLIGLDGRVVDVVDPLNRAYGAGFSAFLGEWAVTNRRLKGSVNNFALHVSLETPIDGEDMDAAHSGYTANQYDALALVLSDWINTFNFPAAAITTHRHVDLGGERSDPRSFDWSALQSRLAALGNLCAP